MTVIKIENLWKEYRLGVIGHGTLTADLQSCWARFRNNEDPNAKITPTLAGQEKQIDGDRFWALRDINLELKQGEILGIIGSNGAGKSTLLKILSRVTAPSRGDIKVKGRIASLLEVGTGFHPELTGHENIFMNGAILGMSKLEIKNKLDEIVDFSGVSSFLNTPVKRYSSGMRVRLGFAVAAHLEPEILIVDEVLAVGDAAFQKKCLAKMNDVATQGRTVLFVSHNMLSIKSLCDRGVLLENGTIALDDDIDKVVSNYLSLQNINAIKTNISERKDRKGTGEVLFEKVVFLNNKMEEFDRNIISGDEVNIKLILSANKSVRCVVLAIAFFSNSGHLLFSCLSSAIGKSFDFNKGNNEVVCNIKKWPLSAGRYHYNVNARILNIYADMVKEAGYLEVGNGDFYGSGCIPAKNHNTVLTQYNYID